MKNVLDTEKMLSNYGMITEPVYWEFNIHVMNLYLKRVRIGYSYIQAMSFTDSVIRNEGIGGFQKSNGWPLIWPALKGAEEFKLNELAECLKSIIYYYHKRGRSRLKKVIPLDYFNDYSLDENLKPDDLSSKYYNLYPGQNEDSNFWRLNQFFPKIVENHSHLFEIPNIASDDPQLKVKCKISDSIVLNEEPLHFCIKQKADGEMSGWNFLSKNDMKKKAILPEELIDFPLAFIRLFDNSVETILNVNSSSTSVYERTENGVFALAGE